MNRQGDWGPLVPHGVQVFNEPQRNTRSKGKGKKKRKGTGKKNNNHS